MTATTESVQEPTNSLKKPLYEVSTQFSHWRFSSEQLEHTRIILNAAAVDAIRKAIEVDSPGSSADMAFLIAKDEQLLVKFYVHQVSQLCGRLRFPEEVEATAVSYLKRFYLKNTVMDWHPKNVMLTALFLATKTTNNPISLEAYTSNIPRTLPADVLDLEFLVAQSLNFEFAVWHAHRALWGLWLDLQSLPGPPSVSKDLYDAALGHVRAARLTDAELIYTPSQIALACLSLCSPALAEGWARMKDAAGILDVVDSIKNMIQTSGSVPAVNEVREVDRRLKLCKNPEKVPGTKAFLAKQAEEDRFASEKRARKVEEVQRATEDDDPFGSELARRARAAVLDDDDD